MKRLEPPPPIAPILNPGPNTGLAVAGSSSETSLDAVLARLHTQLLAAHQAFLARQAEAHNAYLHLNTQITAQLRIELGKHVGAPDLETLHPPSARSLTREQLEAFATNRAETAFGPLFADLDQYPQRVRLPQPPLLLLDRVLRLEGEPGGMGQGTVIAETDVAAHSWCLHQGHMPASLLLESCQANLLLIAWLGADRQHHGTRLARLLGFTAVFHDVLPQASDTVRHDVHIERHAHQGDTHLFFFHMEGRVNDHPRLTLHDGQAGFFTRQTLNHPTGLNWEAASAPYTPNPRLDPPHILGQTSQFGPAAVQAWGRGELARCFGAAYQWASTHTRTPVMPTGRLQLIDAVTAFEPLGGSAQRGYLSATRHVSADDWFFAAHFKDDPCMPGNLMAEGCWQAMAFYLTALGYTLPRDGWRFEPVPETPYTFRFRGQVTPVSRQLTYEVFVDECIADPYPTLYAHVLCRVDGVLVFCCERLGMRLVPDWPIRTMPELLAPGSDCHPTAKLGDFPFDQPSLLHCALGNPAQAFGPTFQIAWHRRVPRLPAPPFLFVSRIVQLGAEWMQSDSGAWVEAAYDAPPEAWYFQDNRFSTMPYCVLIEVGMQVCGWLAVFTGGCFVGEGDLLFRNLDGDAVQHREVRPGDGTLDIRATLVSVVRMEATLIETFQVEITCSGEAVLSLRAVFGFFPAEMMVHQKGFTSTVQERTQIDMVGSEAEMAGLLLPTGKLRMIDRITGYWPQGGTSRQGLIRGEKTIAADDWFFKAHFFRDPVQPGSLGLAAILQLLQWYLLQQVPEADLPRVQAEPIYIGQKIEWHFRGQVTPGHEKIVVLVDISDTGRDAQGPYVMATGSLWADGVKIYQVPQIGLRLVVPLPLTETVTVEPWRLEIANHPWLRDHRPTYTSPTLSLTFELDQMVQAATAHFPEQQLLRIDKAEALRWMVFRDAHLDGRTQVECLGAHRARIELQIPQAVNGETQFVAAARADITFTDAEVTVAAPELSELVNPRAAGDPYQAGLLFHGLSFQLLRDWRLGDNGSRGKIQLTSRGVPTGLIHPGVLDAALHVIPHTEMARWCQVVPPDMISYPLRLEEFSMPQPLPHEGEVTVEARFVRLDAQRFPIVQLWLYDQGEVLAWFQFIGILLPQGLLGQVPPLARRAFLADKRYVPDVGLSRVGTTESVLQIDHVKQGDWLPGTVAQIYGLTGDIEDIAPAIAQAEHAAQYLRLHPSCIVMADGYCDNLPLNRFHIDVITEPTQVRVQSTGPESLDWRQVRSIAMAKTEGRGAGLHDLIAALMQLFVRYIVLEAPADFTTLKTRPVLYLANHQVGIESLLFLVVAGVLAEPMTKAIAKQEHAQSWFGALNQMARTYLHQELLWLFDRDQPHHLLERLRDFSPQDGSAQTSLLVHVDGTRALRAGQGVRQVSGVLLDLALQYQLPIVPVRFVGGLPITDNTERFEFPVGMGQQDYYIGRSISPETLAALPYKERANLVRQRLNHLGPALETDTPLPTQTDLVQHIREIGRQLKVTPLQATLIAALRRLDTPCPETQQLLDYLASGIAPDPRADQTSLLFHMQCLLSV